MAGKRLIPLLSRTAVRFLSPFAPLALFLYPRISLCHHRLIFTHLFICVVLQLTQAHYLLLDKGAQAHYTF
jgi:hypothetical protein